MYIEENALEKALRKAANEPADRPEFYRLLLESTVLVISPSGQGLENAVALEAGSTVNIQNWQKPDGSLVIPFFSSLQALERAIERSEDYLILPAREFFEMTHGSSLMLNPRSDYGKEFFPNEIEALLSVGVNKLMHQRVVEKETRVLLSQPKEYPAVMVASLTALLAKHSNVNAAYLAQMHDSTVDEKPCLIIGIEAEDDFERVIQEAGMVVSDLTPNGQAVDLFRVVRGERGVSRYFTEEVEPFYKRSWGSKLKSALGAGRA